MQYQFDLINQGLKNINKITADLSHEKLTIIPEGFNNNIAWNMVHVLVTQQLLCYGLSGQPMLMPADVVENFKKGSRPPAVISPELIQFTRQKLESHGYQLALDYQYEQFGKITKYPTSFGIELTSIEDAIAFNNLHIGMHFGYILALIRALKSSK